MNAFFCFRRKRGCTWTCCLVSDVWQAVGIIHTQRDRGSCTTVHPLFMLDINFGGNDIPLLLLLMQNYERRNSPVNVCMWKKETGSGFLCYHRKQNNKTCRKETGFEQQSEPFLFLSSSPMSPAEVLMSYPADHSVTRMQVTRGFVLLFHIFSWII